MADDLTLRPQSKYNNAINMQKWHVSVSWYVLFKYVSHLHIIHINVFD